VTRLPELVFEAARCYRGRSALALRRGLRTRVWTYTELADQLRAGAARLAQAGLKPGDRVAMLAPNSPELAIGMLAVWQAGGVLVPLDLRTPANVAARIGRGRPQDTATADEDGAF
jgi:long-chain acyl-CoA synthetase